MSRLQAFLEHRNFTFFIIGLILLNAALLGLETDDVLRETYGGLFHRLDQLILGIFVVELSAKLVAYRKSFFSSGWNWFDLIIVTICLIPASGPLSVLRALRVFRVLRLLSVVPSLRRVISALLQAIPGMTSILSVLLVIYYVAAVLATHIFGNSHDAELETLFGSIGQSMFTLFQMMTLDGWRTEIAEPVLVLYPWAWVFFVIFIIITSFAVLNLFIGVIVDAMNIIHEEENREMGDVPLHADIKLLRADIEELRRQLASQKTG